MRTPENHTLCVVIDAHHVERDAGELDSIKRITGQILAQGENLSIPTEVLLSLQRNNDPRAERTIRSVQREYPGKVNGVITEGDYKAAYYTRGLREGARRASLVVEMDAGGTHDPKDLPKFVKGLKKSDVIFSSRFVKGGVDGYRWQRRMLSRGVTTLGNTFLGTRTINREGTRRRLSDGASGYQGARAYVVEDLFNTYPDDNWQSVVHGPVHMIQTEFRAYVSKLAKERGYTIAEVPIRYGVEIEGQGRKLPANYIWQNLKGFYEVWKRMRDVGKRIEETHPPKK